MPPSLVVRFLTDLPLILPIPLRRLALNSPVAYLPRRLYRWLVSGNTTHIVTLQPPLDGYRMRINPLMDKAFLYGTFEPALCETIVNRVRPGWTCLDVGANIGYVTLLLSLQVGERGSVYAFEPLPAIFSTLQENLELNRLSHIAHPVCLALSDCLGTREFSFRSETLTGGGSLVSSSPSGYNAQVLRTRVQTASGDAYLSSLNPSLHIDFIKIDVEGAEGLVIKGLYNTIQADHPLIIMEAHDCEGSTAVQANQLLLDLGYSPKRIDDIHLLAE